MPDKTRTRLFAQPSRMVEEPIHGKRLARHAPVS